jgi:hypothetical protein
VTILDKPHWNQNCPTSNRETLATYEVSPNENGCSLLGKQTAQFGIAKVGIVRMVMEVLKECLVLVLKYYRFKVDYLSSSHYFALKAKCPAPVPNFQIPRFTPSLEGGCHEA